MARLQVIEDLALRVSCKFKKKVKNESTYKFN